MKSGAKAKENVKYEVKRNGKGEMKTLLLSAAEGIERARARAEAKMRGACGEGHRKSMGKVEG